MNVEFTRAQVLILKILAVLAVVILVTWIFWRAFILPGELRTEAQQAKQDTRSAQGEAAVTSDAMNTMAERTVYRDTVHTITRENTREILSASGAQDQVPPAVHDAGIRAIRLLRAAPDQRDDPPDRLPVDRP